MRAFNLPRYRVARDIQLLGRTFGAERLTFVRRVATGTTTMGQVMYGEVPVFDGEALWIPAGGTVERYGLGEVEQDKPVALVPGTPDIRQGDQIVHKGVRYRVQYAPNQWQAFSVVTLDTYQQGS